MQPVGVRESQQIRKHSWDQNWDSEPQWLPQTVPLVPARPHLLKISLPLRRHGQLENKCPNISIWGMAHTPSQQEVKITVRKRLIKVQIMQESVFCNVFGRVGLNQNGPCRLTFSNTQFQVGRPVQEGLLGMALLGEICHGVDFTVSEAQTTPSYAVCWACGWRCQPSSTAPASCLLACCCEGHGLYPSGTVSPN